MAGLMPPSGRFVRILHGQRRAFPGLFNAGQKRSQTLLRALVGELAAVVADYGECGERRLAAGVAELQCNLGTSFFVREGGMGGEVMAEKAQTAQPSRVLITHGFDPVLVYGGWRPIQRVVIVLISSQIEQKLVCAVEYVQDLVTKALRDARHTWRERRDVVSAIGGLLVVGGNCRDVDPGDSWGARVDHVAQFLRQIRERVAHLADDAGCRTVGGALWWL